MRHRLLFVAAALGLRVTGAFAQQGAVLTQPPDADNQRAEVAQWIGLVKVDISYHSPRVHFQGRERTGHIYGELVPYGLYDEGFGPSRAAPWRAGANESTILTVSHDVMIEGKPLKAGSYALFLELAKSGPWTWILSNNPGWGAFQYDPKDVVLRASTTPQEATFTEFLTYGFDNRLPNSATAYLQWENKRVPLKIDVPNVNELYAQQMGKELRGWAGFSYQNWQAAAQFAADNKVMLDDALVWANKAIYEPFRNAARGREDFSTLSTKASVLRAMGHTKDADTLMERATRQFRPPAKPPLDLETFEGAAGGDRVIPTRYSADRFFAVATLPRGDTATFFLDTGSGSYVWEPYMPYLELSAVDTLVGASGAKSAVVPFPTLRPDNVLPPAVAQSPQGTRLIVYPVDPRARNTFAAWIGRTTQGQLGRNWFNGRVWTFDYPKRRLTLHEDGQAIDSRRGREVPFYFPVDSAGRRVGHTGSVDVVIDGDTVAMLMDTGATIWLKADALATVKDGGPSERATSHLPNWEYARLHERHPDWPVIEHADLWDGLSLIRVQHVSIAGYELGPTWFSVLRGPATPPDGPPNAPAWMKRQGGTVGGSLLRNFVMTLDYPRGVVRLEKP